VAQDARIAWPDSFAYREPTRDLYFTTSQIHLTPDPPAPYRIFKLRVE
jgi:hypothetical protein